MEPVFATFFAVWLGGESLTSRMVVGGGLVLDEQALLGGEVGRLAQRLQAAQLVVGEGAADADEPDAAGLAVAPVGRFLA